MPKTISCTPKNVLHGLIDYNDPKVLEMRKRMAVKKFLSIYKDNDDAPFRATDAIIRVFGGAFADAKKIVDDVVKVGDEPSKFEKVLNAAGLFKSSFAAGDISGAGRQGRAFWIYPRTYAKAFKRQLEVVFGKGDEFSDAQAALYERVLQRDGDLVDLQFTTAGSYIRGGEEAFPAGSPSDVWSTIPQVAQRVIGRVPFAKGAGRVYNRIVENTNEGYVGFLNDVSANTFVNQVDFYDGIGKPMSLQQKHDLANALNHGRMRLTTQPDPGSQAAGAMAMANFFVFSPGMRGSRAQFIFKEFPAATARVMTAFLKSGDNASIFEIASAADIATVKLGIGWAASTAAMYAIAIKSLGIDSVELDPEATNFMRAELGEYGLAPAAVTAAAEIFGIGGSQYKDKAYLDLSNGASNEIRLVFRLLTGRYKNSDGKYSNIQWESNPMRLVPGGNQLVNALPADFPVAGGLLSDIEAKGKKPGFGQPTKNSIMRDYIANSLSPAGRALGQTFLKLTADEWDSVFGNPILGSLLFGWISNALEASGVFSKKKKTVLVPQ